MPEARISELLRENVSAYQAADLFAKADLKLNIEAINLEDESNDVVVVNHVLEHVNFRQAASEISRILKPKGRLICSVPQNTKLEKHLRATRYRFEFK